MGRKSEEFDRVRLRHSQSARNSTAQKRVDIVLLPSDLRVGLAFARGVLFGRPCISCAKSCAHGQCAYPFRRHGTSVLASREHSGSVVLGSSWSTCWELRYPL